MTAATGGNLRIALVHGADQGRGAEQCVLALHRGLGSLGHASTLFVGSRLGSEVGVEEIQYQRGIPGSRRLARAIERRFGLQDIYNPSFRALQPRLSADFDVVHFHSLWGSAGYADLWLLPRVSASMPALITMHDEWLFTGHCAYHFDCNRWLEGCGSCPNLATPPAIPRDGTRANWRRKKDLLAGSNLHVVGVSEWLVEQARRSPILKGKPMSCIYNGIDIETFSPIPDSARASLRESMGIAPEEVVVLLAGQTVEGIHQGIATHHAVKAINSLSGDPRVRPLVVGHSAPLVAAQLKFASKVAPFQESKAALADLYRIADLTLVTSEVETFGRIAAESQACGTPVVCFDTGGLPEVVQHSGGGLVVPRLDGDALLQALEELVSSPAARQRLGAAGRSHVVEHFDEAGVAARHVELYRRLIEARAGAVDG